MTFFGLTWEYRDTLFDEILYLCTNSEGGISYSEAYSMPIAYRAVLIKKISNRIKQRNEQIEKQQYGENSLTMSDLAKTKQELPDFVSPRAARK